VKLAVVTLFPEMFKAITEYGVCGRAVGKGIVKIGLYNPRVYTNDRHQSVDDRPYGGGPGMVLKIEPLRGAIAAAKSWTGPDSKVVYMSPQGQILTQQSVVSFAATGTDLILVAGRYEGVDERLIMLEVDEEWSVGDYVVSGGELPAMILMDAIMRLIPGVLGKLESADDSFSDGLLNFPVYTRPEYYEGLGVPEVLLSGNHQDIEKWRAKQALTRTRQRRPELLTKLALDEEQSAILASLNDEIDEIGE
jgi:tRNA (guanine37-N1)-methyltransferase